MFFVVGFGMAAWAPLVPFAQSRSGIGNGGLGALLLGLGVGSIATMSMAGSLAARFGCRSVVLASAVPLCLSLPLLATVADPAALAGALLLFGGALGALDVSMNLQAIIVERASRRAMMSGFHGLFSVGGIAGAGSVTAILGLGASPLTATLAVVAVLVVAIAAAAPHLLAYGSARTGPMFAIPRGIVLFIGVLCGIAFLAEGAVLDWSAVLLKSAHGMASQYAGLGYAVFSLTMTLGRLTGDRIVARFGGTNVVITGGLCAALGFALATLAPSWPLALLGFALVGSGCANIVPVLYSEIGRQTEVPEHQAVAAITTLGYAGILAGPAMIGLVAHATSLSAAYLMLMLLQLGVAWGGRRLRG